MDTSRETARARALRAARVVSVAATLALGPVGCAQSHQRGVDGAIPIEDAGLADAGADAGTDAGTMACPEPTYVGCCDPMPRECCEADYSGMWDEAGECCITCVEGPMVPPSAPV